MISLPIQFQWFVIQSIQNNFLKPVIIANFSLLVLTYDQADKDTIFLSLNKQTTSVSMAYMALFKKTGQLSDSG